MNLLDVSNNEHPIRVTGVSFGDQALEIIFINEEEQFEERGEMHTIYISTKSEELSKDYELLQSMLRDLIEYYYAQKKDRTSNLSDYELVDLKDFEHEVNKLRQKLAELEGPKEDDTE